MATGSSPVERPLHVHVTILGEECDDEHRGGRMADALSAIADSGGLKGIDDAGQWQGDIRIDRPLPDRGEQ